MNFLADPITFIAEWLRGLLVGWGLSAGAVTFIMKLLGVVAVGSFGLIVVIFLIWLERKVAARFQQRLGPNRVGPWGLFQTFADMVKIFTKEHITPKGVDVVVYNMAPLLSVAAVILLWAVIPFTPKAIGADLNVGVLYLVAVGALGTLAILMAGWSSNNKYALLGAFRTVAQMVSYEVPMVLALLVPVLLSGTMGVNGIIKAQSVVFFVVSPLAALLFFISSLAEIGRTPFDLLEGESEIVAGYHIEYSGLKFGMFFVGEFLHAFTISALFAALFLGGWRGWGAEQVPILGFVYFMLKTFAAYFVVMWVRGTLPRVRIDHMLNFNWKFLTPVGLILLVATAVVQKIVLVTGAPMWVMVLAHLIVNLLIAWGAVQIARMRDIRRPRRKPVAQPRPVARPPETTQA
ncbi:MAG: NADH-quinone oxidoreductase subunit NuoH [Anaerolineae bacterium]|nr:MAG: NADH-quinone oxidoreductase subunit NuoH [Anaerolineae bacterium]